MTLAILVAGALLACGGKKAAPEAAAVQPAPAEAPTGLTGDYPGDSNSKRFAEALIGIEIKNFAAVDGVGAQVMLTSLRFAGDNTWAASGWVDAGEERMECNEQGSWTMEPADSPTNATLTWIIQKTDCVGREAGTKVRAQVLIKGDDVEINFR